MRTEVPTEAGVDRTPDAPYELADDPSHPITMVSRAPPPMRTVASSRWRAVLDAASDAPHIDGRAELGVCALRPQR